MRHLGAVASGLACLLATAALYGCSSPSAEDKAFASAAKLARKDINEAADLVTSWLQASTDLRADYENTKNSFSRNPAIELVTLLQSRYVGNVMTFDITATNRGGADNGFGGGHTEKTIRMCARLTLDVTQKPRHAEISNLNCPPGLPSWGYEGPVERIIPWEK